MGYDENIQCPKCHQMIAVHDGSSGDLFCPVCNITWSPCPECGCRYMTGLCPECGFVPDLGVQVRQKPGRCADGYEGGHGILWHAVVPGQHQALCGTQPGRRTPGWSGCHSSAKVTCPRCARRLERRLLEQNAPIITLQVAGALEGSRPSSDLQPDFIEHVIRAWIRSGRRRYSGSELAQDIINAYEQLVRAWFVAPLLKEAGE